MARKGQGLAESNLGQGSQPGGVGQGSAKPAGGRLLRWAAAALLGAVTAAMLTFSFAPFNVWPLAYGALVPWLVALYARRGRTRPVVFSWCVGLAFWAANLYWLWWITLVGYAAMVLYLSLYWLAAGALLREAMRRRWPMWITLPVLWVALEYARDFVISGFPWFSLAHSQWSRTPLIQIADLTGQYGLSFFVAMANGAVADLVLVLAGRRLQPAWQPPRAGRLAAGWAATVLACGGLIVYGLWRMSQSPAAPGPVIALVQHAYPISLTGDRPGDEKVLADHIASCRKFAGSAVDLVIWPETTLPDGLNPSRLQLDLRSLRPGQLRSLAASIFGPEAWARTISDEVILVNLQEALELDKHNGYAQQVAELSRELGCPILAGGAALQANPFPPVDRDDLWVTRNSAMLFEGSPLAAQSYSKVHLVPFGEYVPFKRSWPGLHRWLRSFVPGVMAQLDPGQEFTVFQWGSQGRQWRLACPICYEGTFARVCRRMVMGDDGRKRVDLLANISNDGWFVYRRLGKGAYQGSTEHAQHLVQYCFRAVETRVPVVRSVNTGISASIDSCGRLVADVGIDVDNYRKRTMVSGTLLLDGAKGPSGEYLPGHGPQVLVDGRVSVYSLVGDVFAMGISAAGIVLLCVLSYGFAVSLAGGVAGALAGRGGPRKPSRKREDR